MPLVIGWSHLCWHRILQIMLLIVAALAEDFEALVIYYKIIDYRNPSTTSRPEPRGGSLNCRATTRKK
jgi:hypothetical protein